MTLPSEPSADDLLAYRLVEKTQRAADAAGRDVRVLLALTIILLDRKMVEHYVVGEPLVRDVVLPGSAEPAAVNEP